MTKNTTRSREDIVRDLEECRKNHTTPPFELVREVAEVLGVPLNQLIAETMHSRSR